MHFSILVAVSVSIFGFSALGATKTCNVKGMHCSGCVDMVKERVCDNKDFAKCDVRVVNKDEEAGVVTIETKSENTKLDVAAMNKKLEGTDYKVTACH